MTRPTPLTEIFASGQTEIDVTSPLSPDNHGVLIHLTDETMIVRFPRPSCPAIPLDKSATLRIDLGALYPAFPVHAQVIQRREWAHHRQYTFSLREPIAVPIENRRRTFRVSGERGEEAILRVGDESQRVALLNVSATGVGVLIDGQTEARLFEVERCEVGLVCEGQPVSFTGLILYRQRFREGIKLGIEFALKIDDQRDERRLRDHIMQRQRLMSRQSIR